MTKDAFVAARVPSDLKSEIEALIAKNPHRLTLSQVAVRGLELARDELRRINEVVG